MEEDVETKSLSDPGNGNCDPKEECIETMENDASNTESFKPLQYHSLSRILTINPLLDIKNASSAMEADSGQKTEQMDDAAVSFCVCGEPSTKGISVDDTQQLQVIYFL